MWRGEGEVSDIQACSGDDPLPKIWDHFHYLKAMLLDNAHLQLLLFIFSIQIWACVPMGLW